MTKSISSSEITSKVMQQVLSLQYLSCLSLPTIGVHTSLFAGYNDDNAGFICKVPPFDKYKHIEAIKDLCSLAECLATSSISFSTSGKMWDASVPLHGDTDTHSQVALVHYVDTQAPYFIKPGSQHITTTPQMQCDGPIQADPTGVFSIDASGNIVDYHQQNAQELAASGKERIDISRSYKDSNSSDVLTFFWPLVAYDTQMAPSVIVNGVGPLYEELQLASFKAGLRATDITWAEEEVRNEAARLIDRIECQGGKFLFLNPMLVTPIARRLSEIRGENALAS